MSLKNLDNYVNEAAKKVCGLNYKDQKQWSADDIDFYNLNRKKIIDVVDHFCSTNNVSLEQAASFVSKETNENLFLYYFYAKPSAIDDFADHKIIDLNDFVKQTSAELAFNEDRINDLIDQIDWDNKANLFNVDILNNESEKNTLFEYLKKSVVDEENETLIQ